MTRYLDCRAFRHTLPPSAVLETVQKVAVEHAGRTVEFTVHESGGQCFVQTEPRHSERVIAALEKACFDPSLGVGSVGADVRALRATVKQLEKQVTGRSRR